MASSADSLDSVVNLITRLQSACALLGDIGDGSNKDLPSLWKTLPTIAVVGGQSSGKSSLLEAIVGRDFLPRGSNIVTKCPLLLTLNRLDDPNAPEHGVFGHSPKTKFTDFAKIKQEIEDETEREVAKLGRTVSPNPIFLTISSPNVPNLSLIDLPGLVQISLKNQEESLPEDLRRMVTQQVKSDNVVILAVSSASQDIATSEAMKLARDVDPAFNRTIGVLTKLDLANDSRTVRENLTGQTYHLRHGWSGVVNRGAQAIRDNMTITEARREERKLLSQHPDYNDLPNVGMDYLSKRLSEFLITAIHKQLPVINNSVNSGIRSLEKELADLGPNVDMSRAGMVRMILKICRQFEREFAETLDNGEGGERVLDVFERDFPADIRNLPYKELLSIQNVILVCERADGFTPHLLAPEKGYRKLIKEAVGKLRGPSVECVLRVHAILDSLTKSVANSRNVAQLKRYPNLKSEIIKVSADGLEAMLVESKRMASTMVSMEEAYVTQEYFQEARRQKDVSTEARPGHLTAKQERYWEIARDVEKYLQIIIRQMQQTIPKAIVHCSVTQSKETLLAELQDRVIEMSEIELRRLLGENDTVTRRRGDCQKRLELLKVAADEISKVPIVDTNDD